MRGEVVQCERINKVSAGMQVFLWFLCACRIILSSRELRARSIATSDASGTDRSNFSGLIKFYIFMKISELYFGVL